MAPAPAAPPEFVSSGVFATGASGKVAESWGAIPVLPESAVAIVEEFAGVTTLELLAGNVAQHKTTSADTNNDAPQKLQAGERVRASCNDLSVLFQGPVVTEPLVTSWVVLLDCPVLVSTMSSASTP